MTGLLRTTLFFFLPVFLALAVYHSWIGSPEAARERRALARAAHAAAIEATREACETMLRDGTTGSQAMPGALEEAGVILAEVVSDSTQVLRLLSGPLDAAGGWTLVPDPAEAPDRVSGFRFSAGDRSIPSVLFEETVYQADGDPARLNVYVRQKSVSNHD
ncbi:MAG: hypothetical protein ACLFRP_01480 [Puniceicoccaceae bacterium]